MKKLILFVLAVVSMAYGQTTTFISMGGINDQTANYLVVATDVGKIVRMNCASCTVTLPSVPPYLRWSVFISNINSSALTVSPNGVSLDGSTSSLSLAQNQSVWISTDGTVYGTVRGGGAGTTAAADQSLLFSQTGTIAGDGLLTYDYINKIIGWPAPFVATTSWPGTPLSPPGAGKTTFGPDTDGTFKTCVGVNPCTAPGSASFPDGTTLAPGLPATLHPELGLAIVLSKIAYPITNVARATNVVTITVSTPNTGLNWPVNGTISTFGLLTPYDVLNCARCTLLSVTGGTPTSTFTYTLAGADVGSAAATGSSSIYETQLTGYSVALTRMDTTSNNPAQRGSIRLGHNDAMEARNIGNTDDMWLIGGVSGVDEVQVGGQSSGFLGTYLPGYIRGDSQTAPANPSAATKFKLYVDSGTGVLTCLLGTVPANCMPASSAPAFSSITAGTNTTAAMVAGGSSSVSPNTGSAGQVAASQTWFTNALAPPVLTGNTTGGSLAQSHAIQVVYTLVTLLGETDISQTAQVTTPTCAAICSVTVTAPTIPTGYTGYTVYSYDGNNTPTGPYKRQAASNNCTNITTNCVIQVVGAGAAPPTTNTAVVQPANVQADVCAPGVRNAMYVQAADGNYYVQAGNDTTNTGATPPAPYSAFTFCRRTWFNDTGVDPPGFKNSFVLINHQAGIGTNPAVQDRALGILYSNPVGDVATRWGLEGMQLELDFNGTPTINGSPDGEVTALSLQHSYSATAASQSCGSFGCNVIRSHFFRQAGAGYSNSHGSRMTSIFAINQNNSTVSGGSSSLVGIDVQVYDQSGAPSNILGEGIEIESPGANRLTQNWGIYINDFGSNANDRNIESAAAASEQGKSYFDGKILVNHVQTTGVNRVVAAPTCASTGSGTSPSCAVDTGSNDSSGTITVTAGTTPGASGTITLTYNATYGTNSTTCIGMLSNAGTGAWSARASLIGGTMNTTSAVFNWDNNAVNLTGASTYKLNYHCFAK